MLEVGKQSRLMPPKGHGGFPYRLQPTVRGPEVPRLVKGPSRARVGVVPKTPELFLDGKGPAHLQVFASQGTENFALLLPPILRTGQPDILGPLQALISFGLKRPVLGSADLVHRLGQIGGRVVPVMDPLRLRQNVFHRIAECLPKVRGHRFHSLSLLGAQAGQGRLRRFFVPPRRHLQNPPTLDIRQNGGVALSFQETLLIHAQVRHDLPFPLLKLASRHGPAHNRLSGVPGNTQDLGTLIDASAAFKYQNGESFELQGESPMGLGPRHQNLKHVMLWAIRPGHFTFDLGLEGHLGKMPPAFFTSVLDRTELSALGTMGHGSKGVGNLDGNLSPVQIHGNRANLPRGGQLQKPSVMLHDHGIRFAQWIGQITLQKCPEKLALPHRCRKNPIIRINSFSFGGQMSFGANYLGEGKCRFEVWAPDLEQLSIRLASPGDAAGGNREKALEAEMEKGKNGIHFLYKEGVTPGTDYTLLLPDGAETPDPASYFQPEGVKGPSRIVDHSAFAWRDGQWQAPPMREFIIYEIHTGTFTARGDFQGIAEKIPHLLDLGVTALEIMPMAQFPGARNWGYDGVFPFAVQDSYGGPDGLKFLVDACHRAGLAVILDVVYNHFGPEGNGQTRFGPMLTDRYQTAWG